MTTTTKQKVHKPTATNYTRQQLRILQMLENKNFTAIDFRIFLIDNGFIDLATLSDRDCERLLPKAGKEEMKTELEASFSLEYALSRPDSEKLDKLIELVRKS